MTKISNTSSAAMDMMLQSGTWRAPAQRLLFQLFFRPFHFAASVVVAIMGSLCLFRLDIISSPTGLMVVYCALSAGLLMAAIVFFNLGRATGPAYIESALRALHPDDRLELLSRVDTVGLRSEHTPVVTIAVVEEVHALRRARKHLQARAGVAKLQAQIQLALIDAYRAL